MHEGPRQAKGSRPHSRGTEGSLDRDALKAHSGRTEEGSGGTQRCELTRQEARTGTQGTLLKGDVGQGGEKRLLSNTIQGASKGSNGLKGGEGEGGVKRVQRSLTRPTFCSINTPILQPALDMTESDRHWLDSPSSVRSCWSLCTAAESPTRVTRAV